MAAFTNPGGTPAAENERFEQEEVVIGAEGEEALVVGGATDAACALNKSSAGAARGSTLGRGHQGHPPRQAPATLQKATPLDDDGQDENGDQQHEGGADAEQEAAAQLLGPNGQPVAVLPNKLHDTLLVGGHTREQERRSGRQTRVLLSAPACHIAHKLAPHICPAGPSQ
jgi:hypothetical protein